MVQLGTWLLAVRAPGSDNLRSFWWMILAVVVFAMVMPLAYLFGRHGGRAGE
ncbi:MAG TPA: hypothetical protein VF997_01680 [Polyangia bacterium]